MNAPRSPVTKVDAPTATLAVPHDERMLASAAYFSALVGFWLVVPAAVYFWKGRQSRFLGFHAVQAVLLQIALIPIGFFGLGVAMAIMLVLETAGGPGMAALGTILGLTVAGLVVMAPMAATVWLGLCALRGRPRALPLLGRWATRVVSDSEER